jgi:GNAT superfamily N-acetyltransferase
VHPSATLARLLTCAMDVPSIGMKIPSGLTVRPAVAQDCALILSLIHELADFEKLTREVIATEELLRETLFGAKPYAEAIIACLDLRPVGFALYFHNYSTFLGRPGIHLEDLFVRSEARGKGIGKQMLAYVANVAQKRNCGRLEWRVLDWNAEAIGFYRRLGSTSMDAWVTHRLTGDALTTLAAGVHT